MKIQVPAVAAAISTMAFCAGVAAQNCDWSPLGSGVASGVFGLGVYDGTLLIGGQINTAGGDPANNVVRWDGQAFHDFGGGTDGQVNTFHMFQNDLFMGGRFTEAGGNTANYLARWNGQQWVGVTDFVYRFAFIAVNDMEVYDGDLYIGGTFDRVGGSLATFVAKWDGQNWAGLGPTFLHSDRNHRGVNGTVHELHVHDEGQGPKLFVVGGFTRAGGPDVRGIARWDGQEWSDVGGSVTQVTGQYSPQAMATFNGDLYVTGRFNEIGNVPANRIARWDGELWWDVAGGLTGSFTYYGDALTIFDDGRGDALYVAGAGFTAAGGVPAERIARWDGQTWEALGDGIGTVRKLQAWNGGLYAGGSFTTAGGEPASRIARWGCDTECYADCDGNGELNINDFLCFIDAFALGGPYADCNDDGALNVSDFLCFIDEFAQGCP